LPLNLTLEPKTDHRNETRHRQNRRELTSTRPNFVRSTGRAGHALSFVKRHWTRSNRKLKSQTISRFDKTSLKKTAEIWFT
jgi:hypothetical protein